MERKMDYVPFRTGVYDLVVLDGIEWFYYREGEDELPKVGAWCRTCARETAFPVYPIMMNGKEAYALRCDKCGGEYPMYKHRFIARYVGYDIEGGGHINPSHGLTTHIGSMDRKARENYVKRMNEIPKNVEDMMCANFGITHDQYKEMNEKWKEEEKRVHKRFEREEADRHDRYTKNKINEESEKRKDLIARGIIKYVKGVGLVNTETNQVVKL